MESPLLEYLLDENVSTFCQGFQPLKGQALDAPPAQAPLTPLELTFPEPGTVSARGR